MRKLLGFALHSASLRLKLLSLPPPIPQCTRPGTMNGLPPIAGHSPTDATCGVSGTWLPHHQRTQSSGRLASSLASSHVLLRSPGDTAACPLAPATAGLRHPGETLVAGALGSTRGSPQWGSEGPSMARPRTAPPGGASRLVHAQAQSSSGAVKGSSVHKSLQPQQVVQQQVPGQGWRPTSSRPTTSSGRTFENVYRKPWAHTHTTVTRPGVKGDWKGVSPYLSSTPHIAPPALSRPYSRSVAVDGTVMRVLAKNDNFTLVDIHSTPSASQRHASTHPGGAALARGHAPREPKAGSVVVRLAREKLQGAVVGKGTRLLVLGTWGPANSEVLAQQVKIMPDPATPIAVDARHVPASPTPERSTPKPTPLLSQAARPAERPIELQGKVPQKKGEGLKLGVRASAQATAAPPAPPIELQGKLPQKKGEGLRLGTRVSAQATAAPAAPALQPAKLVPSTFNTPAVERAPAPQPAKQQLPHQPVTVAAPQPSKQQVPHQPVKVAAAQPAVLQPLQQPEKAAAKDRGVAIGSPTKQLAQPASPVKSTAAPATAVKVPAVEVALGHAAARPANLPRHAVQVEGVVSRVVYHNVDNGYTVLRVHAPDAPPPPPALLEVSRAAAQATQAKGGAATKWGGRGSRYARGGQRSYGGRGAGAGAAPKGEVVVVGSFFGAAAGQRYRFHGCWENSKFGLQLGALQSEELAPDTLADISRFLAAVVASVGPKTADSIVNIFGMDAFQMLDSDNATKELLKVPRIGPKTAAVIKDSWDEHRGRKRTITSLSSLGFSHRSALQLEAVHGEEVLESLRQDPWTACRDLPNIPFALMDTVAAALGADPGRPSRADCALLCAIEDCCASDGHAFVPWEALLRRTTALLQGPRPRAGASTPPPPHMGGVPASPNGSLGAAAGALRGGSNGGAVAQGGAAQWGVAPAPGVIEAALQRLREEEMVVLDVHGGSGGRAKQGGGSARPGPGAWVKSRGASGEGKAWEDAEVAAQEAELRRFREDLVELGAGDGVPTEQPSDMQLSSPTGTVPAPEVPPGPRDRCYLRTLYEAERLVAGALAERNLVADSVRAQEAQHREEMKRVTEWMEKLKLGRDGGGAQGTAQGHQQGGAGGGAEHILQLSAQQQEVVRGAAYSPTMVLTGGPGCGKTFTTRTVAQLWRAMGKKVELCAPTGRAAQNLSEATGMEAKTIHRLLEYDFLRAQGGPTPAPSKEEDANNPPSPSASPAQQGDTDPSASPQLSPSDSPSDKGGFEAPMKFEWNLFHRHRNNPLEATALIVDESSMLDLPLAAALLSALRSDCQVLFVGDVDQLPPVGPGNFLQDLISSNAIPVVTLTEIFRQSQQSSIVLNAHHINRGQRVSLHALQPPAALPLPAPSSATPRGALHATSGAADGPPAPIASSNSTAQIPSTVGSSSTAADASRTMPSNGGHERLLGAPTGLGPESGAGRGRGRSKWNVEDLPSDCVLLRADDPASILSGVEAMLKEALPQMGFHALSDVQVLTPLNKGAIGTVKLNQMIQGLMNPPGPGKAELRGPRDNVFRVGDRVIQMRNDYEKDVYNGDMGVIIGVSDAEKTLEVDFSATAGRSPGAARGAHSLQSSSSNSNSSSNSDSNVDSSSSSSSSSTRAGGEASGGSKGAEKGPGGTGRAKRVVTYEASSLDDLAPAWAITVHKSQGSEFPVVILPMHKSYGRMLSRRLLYTAITRAKKLVVVVGDEEAVWTATNAYKEHKRNSHLLWRIKSCISLKKGLKG